MAKTDDRLDQDAIASQIVGDLSEGELRRVSAELFAQWVWRYRRTKQLEVERSAARARIDEEIKEEANKKEQRAREGSKKQEDSFRKAYEDPLTAYGDKRDVHVTYNIDIRARFRTWCGDRFEEWQERAEKLVTEKCPEQLDMFRSDWHPGGPTAARYALMAEIINEYAFRVRLELTAELLGSEFALGDGRRVTWGEASTEDHEQRIRMLTSNAVANAEAAARHQAAITIIADAGVERLRQVADAHQETGLVGVVSGAGS